MLRLLLEASEAEEGVRLLMSVVAAEGVEGTQHCSWVVEAVVEGRL